MRGTPGPRRRDAVTGMGSVRVAAHAKVNLSLRVHAREASGYHTLETLFCRLDLADTVRLTVNDAGARSLDWSGAGMSADALGPVEHNLAWRAAEAYARADGWPRGFAIEIEKLIPVGGGLGGGSADAAAVLVALNSLNPRPVSQDALVAIAAALGADVPFLAGNAPLGLAWGRGDRVLMLPPLPERELALVLPAFGVSTPEAYAWLAEERARHPAAPGAAALHLAAVTTWSGVTAYAVNDFERVVFRRRPELGALHARVSAMPGVTLARMSGSGSTLFALFDSELELRAVSQATGTRVIAARTLASVVPPERLD